MGTMGNTSTMNRQIVSTSHDLKPQNVAEEGKSFISVKPRLVIGEIFMIWPDESVEQIQRPGRHEITKSSVYSF